MVEVFPYRVLLWVRMDKGCTLVADVEALVDATSGYAAVQAVMHHQQLAYVNCACVHPLTAGYPDEYHYRLYRRRPAHGDRGEVR